MNLLKTKLSVMENYKIYLLLNATILLRDIIVNLAVFKVYLAFLDEEIVNIHYFGAFNYPFLII